MAPRAKAKLLTNANIDRTQQTRYLALGAELNLLQTSKGSLPSVQLEVACYWRFFQMIGRPSPIPTLGAVPMWSATFDPGKPSSRYRSHLQMESTLLKHPLGWLVPTIRAIGRGRKNAQDLISNFPNFIESEALLRLLAWVKVDPPTGQAYLLSCLSRSAILPIPSDLYAPARTAD